jgi:hypothetical protein
LVKTLKWLDITMDVDEVLWECNIYSFYIISWFATMFVTQFPSLLSGGVHHGMPNIQESHQRILCSQKQGSCPQQTRPLPKVEWEACLVHSHTYVWCIEPTSLCRIALADDLHSGWHGCNMYTVGFVHFNGENTPYLCRITVR